MRARIDLYCAALTTGPMVVVSSRGSPRRKRATSSTRNGTDLLELAFVDQHPGRGMAGLAGVEEGTLDVPPCRAFSRSASGSTMLADLPPSSRQTRFTVSRGGGADLPAGAGRSGEGDHVHVGVARQGVADDAAGAVDQVEHARRQFRLVQHLRQQCAARRGIQARLGDDRASGGERVDGLDDAGLDRPVPRRDQGTHPDRFPPHDGAPDPRLEVVLAQHVSGHPHVLSRPGDLGAAADRNADFTSDQLREVLDVPLVDVDDAIDQGDALLHRSGGEGRRRRARAAATARSASADAPSVTRANASSRVGSTSSTSLGSVGSVHCPSM